MTPAGEALKRKHAEEMGVPMNWVHSRQEVRASGRIKGRDEHGNIWIDASSTGGGETDSHIIPWHTNLSKGQFESEMLGKHATFAGKHEYMPHKGGWGIDWRMNKLVKNPEDHPDHDIYFDFGKMG